MPNSPPNEIVYTACLPQLCIDGKPVKIFDPLGSNNLPQHISLVLRNGITIEISSTAPLQLGALLCLKLDQQREFFLSCIDLTNTAGDAVIFPNESFLRNVKLIRQDSTDATTIAFQMSNFNRVSKRS